RLCTVRPARTRCEAPVIREAQELGVSDERPAFESQILCDDRLHLIEEQLLRHAAEEGERILEPGDQGAHVLPAVEAQPQHARIAENDEQRVAHTPREAEACEVDLRLVAGRRLETDDRLWSRHRPYLPHVLLQLRIAAGIAGSSNLFEQSHARQLRIGFETRPDDWLVGTELRRYRRPWPIPDHIAVQVPVQLSIPDPATNR